VLVPTAAQNHANDRRCMTTQIVTSLAPYDHPGATCMYELQALQQRPAAPQDVRQPPTYRMVQKNRPTFNSSTDVIF